MASKIARTIHKWRSERAFLHGRLDPPVGPRFAQIEPTVRCNLKCIMCPRTLDPDVYCTPDMPRDEYRRILDQLPALEELQMSGFGEPLLHTDLPDMIADAAARGIKVNINTNSTVWTCDLADRILESGVARIKLSLDSADPDEFQRIRGVALDKVCNNIRLLADARRAKGHSSPVLQLNVVVQEQSIAHLDRFFRLAEELGVDRLRFKSILAFHVPELESHRIRHEVRDSIAEFFQRAREAAEGAKVANNFAKFARRFERDFKVEAEDTGHAGKPTNADRTVPQCFHPWFGTFVSNRSVVRPCCKFYRDGMVDLGNLLEQPMQAIWRGDAYRSVREKFVAGRPIHAVCLDCDQHDRSRSLTERARRRYGRLPF